MNNDKPEVEEVMDALGDMSQVCQSLIEEAVNHELWLDKDSDLYVVVSALYRCRRNCLEVIQRIKDNPDAGISGACDIGSALPDIEDINKYLGAENVDMIVTALRQLQ